MDALAHRALALDTTAASAWLALASEDMFRRRDVPRAGERILRARALDRLDPEVAAVRSTWHRFNGNVDSAVVEARLAHQLDPVSIMFTRGVARQLFLARRYEEARQVYERIYEVTPQWRRGFTEMADLYRAMGRPRDAVTWLRRARAAAGDSAGAALLQASPSDSMAERVLREDARRAIGSLTRALKEGKRISPSRLARLHAVLGDKDATLRQLDAMIDANDSYLNQARLDPCFDFLRSDPHYAAWEARTGLPPMATSVR